MLEVLHEVSLYKIYLHDQHKTHKMSDKVILDSDGMVRIIPDCCKKFVIKLLIIILMH